jgi:molybdenum cofactor synthesis domain-containing protein
MQVAIVTVGDELLAGDVENTNATWLARRLSARGVSVERIVTLPDDVDLLAEYAREWADAFDAVVTTGGLGGTPDDVTMAGVAAAFSRDVAVHPDARADVAATLAAFREANPELEARFPDLRIDLDAQASIPEGARYLPNGVGLSPGCVLNGVYVLPGIPEEMYAMFESVADEFGGDVVSDLVYTPAPEGATTDTLAEARDRFTVEVGSYPSREGPNRIKLVGTDPGAVEAATAWIVARVETVDPDDDDGDADGVADELA